MRRGVLSGSGRDTAHQPTDNPSLWMAEEAQEPGFGRQLTRTPGQRSGRGSFSARPCNPIHWRMGSGSLPRPLRPPEGGITRGAEQRMGFHWLAVRRSGVCPRGEKGEGRSPQPGRRESIDALPTVLWLPVLRCVEASEREVQVPGAVFPYHPSPEFCHDELDLLLLLEFQL